MSVVDASVVSYWCLPDESHPYADAAENRIASEDAITSAVLKSAGLTRPCSTNARNWPTVCLVPEAAEAVALPPQPSLAGHPNVQPLTFDKVWRT